MNNFERRENSIENNIEREPNSGKPIGRKDFSDVKDTFMQLYRAMQAAGLNEFPSGPSKDPGEQ